MLILCFRIFNQLNMKEQNFIYRIADKNSILIGFYAMEFWSRTKDIISKCSFSENCPEPCRDKGITDYFLSKYSQNVWNNISTREKVIEPFLFGFRNYDQFSKWFTEIDEIVVKLEEIGFSIYVVEGEVFHSDYQSIIKKNGMNVLDCFSPKVFSEYIP